MLYFQVYGQQDRHVLSLSASSVTGPYVEEDKVLLPPSNYSYSDTGLFFDEASGMQEFVVIIRKQLINKL